MKKLLILVCALLLTTSIYGQWQNLQVDAEGRDFYDVCCISDSVVFACGRGMIYKTIDAGNTWDACYTNDNEQLMSIQFINDSIGFAAGVGFYGDCDDCQHISHYPMDSVYEVLLKTIDGGITWNTFNTHIWNHPYVDETPFFLKIHSIDKDTLYAVKWKSSSLYKSIDGGVTWDSVAFSNEVVYAHFEKEMGYLVLEGGDIYQTKNYGYTWDSIAKLPMSQTMFYYIEGYPKTLFGTVIDMEFRQNGEIDIIYRNKLYQTKDTFQTYSMSEITYRSPMWREPDGYITFKADVPHLQYLSNNMGILLGNEINDGYIVGNPNETMNNKRQKPHVLDCFVAACLSNDGGKTWMPYYHTRDIVWNAVDGKNALFYVAAGDGIVAKINYQDLSISNVEFQTTVNVYPNPAKDYICIDLPEEKIKSIKLYNLLGVLLKEQKDNKTSMDISSLPQGMHLLSIETDEIVITKKIIKQ